MLRPTCVNLGHYKTSYLNILAHFLLILNILTDTKTLPPKKYLTVENIISINMKDKSMQILQAHLMTTKIKIDICTL